MDCPHRATLALTGADRVDFLNRMLTSELKDLRPGMVRAGFWLNRKGRIVADLLLVETGDVLYVDVDAPQAAETVETLSAFLFAEDVEIEDRSDRVHRLALHGASAAALLARAMDAPGADPPEAGAATTVTIAGAEVVVAGRDQVGQTGLELFVPVEQVASVWDALVGGEPSAAIGPVRPIGWYAYNIARIEAGTPLFNVDFGTTNLPHESGVLDDRVSFTKGCYLGQEIVARIQSLGKPKQVLKGLTVQADGLPVAGAPVYEADGDGVGAPVGVVTSSTLSPLLGARPVAFAMLKNDHAGDGSTVRVGAEGDPVDAAVGPLRFWAPEP